jgi:hypothetical protein
VFQVRSSQATEWRSHSSAFRVSRVQVEEIVSRETIMSFNRYAKRPDAVTAQIADELRALGFSVTYLHLPVDLAVHHAKWGENNFKFLECKSRKKKSGEVVLDKRQKDQAEFCELHGVPYVTSTFEALLALGEKCEMYP